MTDLINRARVVPDWNKKAKPCPFCGGRDIRFSEYMTDGGPRENVQCEDCSAELGGWKRPGHAVVDWNTRAYETRIETLEAEVERLRDAVDKMNCTMPIASILQDEDIPSQLFGRLAGILQDQHDALAELKGDDDE